VSCEGNHNVTSILKSSQDSVFFFLISFDIIPKKFIYNVENDISFKKSESKLVSSTRHNSLYNPLHIACTHLPSLRVCPLILYILQELLQICAAILNNDRIGEA
jgi:hypothetical protein